MVAIPWNPLSLKHRYVCLGFETYHDICLMVVHSFYQVLWFHTLARKILQSTSAISFCLMTSHFGGQSDTHHNYSFQWWPIVFITSVASVTDIIQSSCLCHVSIDITRNTWRHPRRLVKEGEIIWQRVQSLCLEKDHLKMNFEGQHSPTH